jgi:hypothetical protein
MKQNLWLTITFLFSILFMSFPLADDLVRRSEKGGASDLIAVTVLVHWL